MDPRPSVTPARTGLPLRVRRRHMPVGAVAVVAVMLAALTGAVPGFSGTANAAPNPPASDFQFTCSGDTLDVEYSVAGGGRTTIGVDYLQIEASGQTSNAQFHLFWIPDAGVQRQISFDVHTYPADATLSVRVLVRGTWVTSPGFAASNCAPPPVVPEAPAAVLLPLSLLLTSGAALLLARSRRRFAAARSRRRRAATGTARA